MAHMVCEPSTCLNSETGLSVGCRISLEDLHNLDKNPLIHFKDSVAVLVETSFQSDDRLIYRDE